MQCSERARFFLQCLDCLVLIPSAYFCSPSVSTSLVVGFLSRLSSLETQIFRAIPARSHLIHVCALHGIISALVCDFEAFALRLKLLRFCDRRIYPASFHGSLSGLSISTRVSARGAAASQHCAGSFPAAYPLLWRAHHSCASTHQKCVGKRCQLTAYH